MKKKGELYFLFFFIIITLISCKAQNMDEKFDWSGTLSAPEEYPMEVVQGELSGEGYGQSFGHWGIISGGWGTPGGTVGAGPDTKQLPDYLGITWISFAEKKVYSGQFTLPKDKILALFKKGFPDIADASKTSRYNTFIVGLAPKGHISIWVGEGAGNQVEVATFKAEETHIDTAKVLEEDKYMFTKKYVDYVLQDTLIVKPEVQEKVKQNGYPNPTNYSVSYPEKYNWQPKVVLPDGYKIKFWQVMKSNGEKEYSFAHNNTLPKEKRAIPYLISGMLTDGKKDYWFDVVMSADQNYLPRMQKDGFQTQIPIDFDKNEINQIFREQLDKNQPADFKININPQNKKVEIELDQQGVKIKLNNFQYQIY